MSVDDSLAIGKTLLAYLKPNQQSKPVVVGATALNGNYAAAIAQPQGEKTIYAFLKQTAVGWEVIEVTDLPSRQLLRQKGVPVSLMQTNDASLVETTWMEQLQDPRGEGAEGTVVVEGIVKDYARVFFSPADPTQRDGFTAFLKRESHKWKQITGGSAFDQATLRTLGIPQELWAGQ